jgi:hypothetical protein
LGRVVSRRSLITETSPLSQQAELQFLLRMTLGLDQYSPHLEMQLGGAKQTLSHQPRKNPSLSLRDGFHFLCHLNLEVYQKLEKFASIFFALLSAARRAC